MTNYERWNEYTSGLPSPQNYIDWSWRYIISAALQRRIWLPPEHQPCFPNMYTILVGPAGIGKGLCITQVSDLLRFWKLKDALKLTHEGKTPEEKQIIEATIQADLKSAADAAINPTNKQVDLTEPYLIPTGSDATTYEALVGAVSKSYRRVSYVAYDEKQLKNVTRAYGHSSVYFSLPELASLLRKRTDDTVNYMLGLYDCPIDYQYDTKNQGKDRVKKGCLNLIAGTTPNFMQQIFNEKLIDQGFGSRTFFIYANKDRKTQFWIPELTEQQKLYKIDLLAHILKLTGLYGQIRMDNAVKDFLEDWWAKTVSNRSNRSSKLDGYYARKKIHIMKVAIANHFGESTEMYIPVSGYEKAIADLDTEEKNMHLAITLESKNPLANVGKKIMELLEDGPKNFVDLHVETFSLADKRQLEDTLSFLTDTGQVTVVQEKDETTDQTIQYWRKK